MRNHENSAFGMESAQKKDKPSFSLPKKILRAGALAAALVSGQEAVMAAPQELQPAAKVEKRATHPYVHYDSLAHTVMLKTGVLFRGEGLFLVRTKKDIAWANDISVIGVEIFAQGQAGLLVRIHKKGETPEDSDNITEIKILDGFVQEPTAKKIKE